MNIEQYGKRLFERRESGVIVTSAVASLGEWRPAENECHYNVSVWCAHQADCQPVRGWLYFHFEYLLPFVRFTAHSVIRSKDGQLYDITPARASQPYPFIEAEEGEAAYAAVIEGLGVQHLDYEVSTERTTAHGLATHPSADAPRRAAERQR